MQQANFKPVTAIKFRSQADYLLPGHGTGMKTPAGNDPASNDETFPQEESGLRLILSVLANVVGGAVLLAAMFNLPVILAVIWGV